MSQIRKISDTLKQLLKSRDLTYKDLASHLDMSEASVKRMFSINSFTLDKLENICDLLHLSLSDLFFLASQEDHHIVELTHEQELELTADPKLFLVAVCARDGWPFEKIIEDYAVSEHEAIQLFARLDKLKMIKFLPGNKYKLMIAQHFRWIPNGPLEKFMNSQVVSEFMSANFTEENSFRYYLRGSYSQASIAIILNKLNQLTKDIGLLNQEDAKLPLDTRQHVGLLLAMRPWELALFERMRRKIAD